MLESLAIRLGSHRAGWNRKVVPEARFELAHPLRRRILSPLRLPFRHSGHLPRRLAARHSAVNHRRHVAVAPMRPPLLTKRGPAGRFLPYGLAAEKVSQSDICPEFSPIWNHFDRCAEVPWVKLSGCGT